MMDAFAHIFHSPAHILHIIHKLVKFQITIYKLQILFVICGLLFGIFNYYIIIPHYTQSAKIDPIINNATK